MTDLEIRKIAETIRLQLMASVSMNTILSWGIDNFTATTYKAMPALSFKVDARLFKGVVVICYNPSDVYEVYTLNSKGCTCISDNVFCDMLGSVIDRAIEVGDNEEEYRAFLEEQRALLMSGNLY